jgi:hypothetical protein
VGLGRTSSATRKLSSASECRRLSSDCSRRPLLRPLPRDPRRPAASARIRPLRRGPGRAERGGRGGTGAAGGRAAGRAWRSIRLVPGAGLLVSLARNLRRSARAPRGLFGAHSAGVPPPLSREGSGGRARPPARLKRPSRAPPRARGHPRRLRPPKSGPTRWQTRSRGPDVAWPLLAPQRAPGAPDHAEGRAARGARCCVGISSVAVGSGLTMPGGVVEQASD